MSGHKYIHENVFVLLLAYQWLQEILNCAVVFQVESVINELLGVRCPDSIIKPSEDTTYLLRDYEDAFVDQYYEHGDRVQLEEPFCGHTSLHTSTDMYLFYPYNSKPIILNSNPWVSNHLCL